MPTLGKRSQKHRDSCVDELADVLDDAINNYDFSVIWGHRGEKAQNKAFNEGNSKARWPMSKHNTKPSKAFDVVPYPLGFKASDEEFYIMALHIFAAAVRQGVKIKWGGHFKSIRDLAHFEIIDD